MSTPSPARHVFQRSCALCGNVDDGPRNQVVVDAARDLAVWYHLPGDPACAVENADPHPELAETAAQSQERHAREITPSAETPNAGDVIPLTVVDASNPGAEPVRHDLQED